MEKYIKLKDLDSESFVKIEEEAVAPAQKNLVASLRLGDLTSVGDIGEGDNIIYLNEQAAIDEDSTQILGEEYVEIDIDKSLQELIDTTEIDAPGKFFLTYVVKVMDKQSSVVLPIYPSLAVEISDEFKKADFYQMVSSIDVETISMDSKKLKVKLQSKPD